MDQSKWYYPSGLLDKIILSENECHPGAHLKFLLWLDRLVPIFYEILLECWHEN